MRWQWAMAGLLALGMLSWLPATATPVDWQPAGGGVEVLRIALPPQVRLLKSFPLRNPPRAVVDLSHAPNLPLSLSRPPGNSLVRAVRFGQFDASTSRIVVDLAEPASVSARVEGQNLVIELHGSAQRAAAAPPPPTTPAKPLIAIDAGHGGQDPGATGLHGTQEREVTLNFARALRNALLRTGKYRVMLTRDDDTFISLGGRVDLARRAGAALFISLHADSNPRPEARGLSLYTLSATASDEEAEALAERENKSDIIAGIDLNTTDADVANILIDLTQRETMNKSTIFADTLVDALHPKIARLAKTHRVAGFRVLKAPDVPSVLIELGFLSNADDERLLLSPEFRDLIVASITKAIDRYYAAQ